MLDLKVIREQPDRAKAGCAAKHVDVDIDRLLTLDTERRQLIQKGDELKAVRNKASEAIGKAKKAGENASEAIAQMKQVNEDIKAADKRLRGVLDAMRDIQIRIPNLPHPSVPVGGEADNVVQRSWGEVPTYDFEVQHHADLGPRLDILDFDRGARLSGSNFITMKGAGAALQRALISFMIDLHVEKHGYTEVAVPFLVRREMMFGTGQLPKMEDDMYHVNEDDLFLIPTAEVPVTNLHREEMLSADDLPRKYVAYTPCFRREAGSYGAETRGLMRIHQFDKVEMVNLVKPEDSYAVLEGLLGEAEDVLKALELPYRVLTLATGDLSFAAAKCYDLEVWAAGTGRWLEVSSCSNFEDFQARRMNLRFRREKGAKPEFVHTLNGSGLALPRTVIAILENYQTDEGTVVVPQVLRKYMGVSVIK